MHYVHDVYDCVSYLEFEDNNLKSSLEKINTHGWHSDKQSLSHNSSLTEEQLVPLLEHTPQDSDTHNFEYINKELLKLINTTPILELIEIDVEAVAIDSQPIISIDDDSVVVKLVDKKIKECSSQVCWSVSVHHQFYKWLWCQLCEVNNTVIPSHFSVGYCQNAVYFVEWKLSSYIL